MPTTFYFIRHAAHGLLGRVLAGRMPGVHLSPEGRTQAETLAQTLSHLPITAVYSSPLERAQETAAPLARALGQEVQICTEIQEMDFGEWMGAPFDTLEGDPHWSYFNMYRSGTGAPSGERMLEVQARMIAAIDRLRQVHPEEHVALIGHGDPIKAALAHFLGVHLDLFQRIEISPASVTTVEIADWGPRVLYVNRTFDLPGC